VVVQQVDGQVWVPVRQNFKGGLIRLLQTQNPLCLTKTLENTLLQQQICINLFDHLSTIFLSKNNNHAHQFHFDNINKKQQQNKAEYQNSKTAFSKCGFLALQLPSSPR